MSIQEEMEFSNVRNFLLKHYNIDIESTNEVIRPLIESSVRFFLSLNTWEKIIYQESGISEESKYLFRECISNGLHIMSFATFHMKIPCLMMIRRTMDIVGCFFCGDEMVTQQSEYSRKMVEDFCEYLSGNDWAEKYTNLDPKEMSDFGKDIAGLLMEQYESISRQLSFYSAKYFSNEKVMDTIRLNRLDIEFMKNNICLLSSLLNTLLIIIYFDTYIEKISEEEKSFIRNAIHSKYGLKSRVVHIWGEI